MSDKNKRIKFQPSPETGEVISVRSLGKKKNEEQKEQKTIEKSVLETTEDGLAVFKVKELPSGFVLYPEAEIYYKDYSWNQVKKLNQSDISISELWKFIKSGITCKNITVEKLTLQDFLYIALLRRLATVGSSKFTVNLECGHKVELNEKEINKKKKCGNILNVVLSDSLLQFDDLALKKDQIPVEINILGEWLSFSPMTLEDAELLVDKNLLDDDNAVISVQCRNKEFQEVYNLLNSDKISFLEGQELDNLELYFFHNLLPITKDHTGKDIVCDKCKKKISISLDGGGTLIRPFRESGLDVRSRIRFGSES